MLSTGQYGAQIAEPEGTVNSNRTIYVLLGHYSHVRQDRLCQIARVWILVLPRRPRLPYMNYFGTVCLIEIIVHVCKQGTECRDIKQNS